MKRFLVDEDLPRSLGGDALGGLDVIHVVDIGLRG